jgi:hypothetical protein
MSLRNRTQALLGARARWPEARLELEDIPSRQSGRRIFVCGSGHVVVQLVSADRQETRYEFRLEPGVASGLLQLCIDHDLIAFKPVLWPGPPSSHTIILRLSYGIPYGNSIRKVAGTTEPRFDAIYQAMLDLEGRTKAQKPTYQGPYQSYYKPKQGLSTVPSWLYRLGEGLWDRIRYFELRDIGRFVVNLLELLRLIWPVLVEAAILLVIAYWWVKIEPTQTYGFGKALVHGFFWWQNALVSLWQPRAIKALLNVGFWYEVGFFIGAIVFPARR